MPTFIDTGEGGTWSDALASPSTFLTQIPPRHSFLSADHGGGSLNGQYAPSVNVAGERGAHGKAANPVPAIPNFPPPATDQPGNLPAVPVTPSQGGGLLSVPIHNGDNSDA